LAWECWLLTLVTPDDGWVATKKASIDPLKILSIDHPSF
jgi:hypothetical protein